MNKNDSFNVKCEKESYDIGPFLHHHPGGINYIAPYRDKDVTKRMKDTNHSKAAFYLIEEYKEGISSEYQQDLEKLVDWDKPMLSQVSGLGNKYKEWVTSPVDRHLRLFENPVLETLTITPWYVVPLIWVPIVIYLIKYGAEKYVQLTENSTPRTAIVIQIFLGIVLWTFLEYSLHRWVFHMEPSGNSKIMIYVHFAIHGLHHKVPFDERRLVFPPFPAAIITIVLYKIASFIIPESTLILNVAGVILGYITYDMIHFYLHNGTPGKNSYFYHLKRYHNQHHFAHQNSGFGISSGIWDIVFGTAIKLRKLNMIIKWQN